MEEQKDLPLPPKDLPLPEKEIPAHIKTKNNLNIKWFIVFIVISGLIAFLIGGFVLGKNSGASKPTETVIQSSPTPTPNPTANWKTYTGNEFIFKYPADWKIDPNNSGNGASLMSPSGDFRLFYDVYGLKNQTSKFKCANCKYTVVATIQPDTNSKAYVVINSSTVNGSDEQMLSLSNVNNSQDSDQGWPYFPLKNDPNYLLRWSGQYISKNCEGGCATIPMSLDEFRNKPEVKTAAQILSTFKFTDSNPTPSKNNTACTQEAKLCPDGSYVGRTGPTCAFAACPK